MPLLRSDNQYSSATGSIFLFNLIVGTGAIALPGALQNAGWIAGMILLIVLAFISCVTVTFVVEALAVANAVSRKRYEGVQDNEVERTPLVETSDAFEVTEKYELGQMGVLLTPKFCQIIIYLTLCLYLFGDLAIYAVVFGRTCSHVFCAFKPLNGTARNGVLDDNDICNNDSDLTVIDVYRICVGVFIACVGPFAFFNLQKTKLLQFFTLALRWLAFFIMLIWSMYLLFTQGREGYPKAVVAKELPTLFGALVYSFMCQHSIPGLFFPIKQKDHLRYLVPIDFGVAILFYLSLCATAIFAFEKIETLYTLNFWNITFDLHDLDFLKILAYYLAFFPAFTLTTNYPLLAITLRNNFRALILKDAPKKWYLDHLLFPLIIIVPPTVLALAVSNLSLLLGIIGAYCGTSVQYLIPCLLVQFARKHEKNIVGVNKLKSPFSSMGWVYAVYCWMVISLVFISINIVGSYLKK